MAQWFIKQAGTFYTRLKQAFWDSLLYDWDDTVCDWDGVSDDKWYSKNAGTWFTKN